jgi:hypothetical protein
MNEHSDLGPLLRDHFASVADTTTPARQLDAVIARTRQERQQSRRRRWPTRFFGGSSVARPIHGQAATVVAMGLAVLLLGGALVLVGVPRAAVPSATVPSGTGPGVFVSVGSTSTIRECPTATTLEDGRVLVVGGWDGAPIASAELFDPETDTFEATGRLLHAYDAHTATLLGDGRVLIAGSASAGTETADPELTAEVWDPTTMTSQPTGAPLYGAGGCMDPEADRSRLLSDGRVLIASTTTAQVWDPATGSFSRADFAADPHLAGDTSRHRGTILADGRILTIQQTEARVWDPATQSSHPAGHLIVPRHYGYFTATLLSDGRVLIVGGEDTGREPLAEAEIWDPTTKRFTKAGSPLLPRSRHAAALLQDGRVLIVGSHGPGLGYPDDGTTTAELFEPG